MTHLRLTGAPIGRISRVLLVTWAMLLMGGFVVARSLEPDSRGFGTHQQLGLPECSVRQMFSRPCPGCGMTTSFSHFIRGEIYSATRANPAGVLLAMVCLLMIPWSLLSAAHGNLWLVDEPLMFLAAVVVAIGAVASIAWLMAIFQNSR